MADQVIRIIDSSKSVFVAVGNTGAIPGATPPAQTNQNYQISKESLTDGKITLPFVRESPNDSPSVFVFNDMGVMVWASDVTVKDPNLVEVDLTGYELVGTWVIRIA